MRLLRRGVFKLPRENHETSAQSLSSSLRELKDTSAQSATSLLRELKDTSAQSATPPPKGA